MSRDDWSGMYRDLGAFRDRYALCAAGADGRVYTIPQNRGIIRELETYLTDAIPNILYRGSKCDKTHKAKLKKEWVPMHPKHNPKNTKKDKGK